MKVPTIFTPERNTDDTLVKLLTKPEPPKIENLEDYIILPGRTHETYSYPDLLIAKNAKHYSSSWTATNSMLHTEGSLMPTPRQFIDFILLLKSGEVYDGKEARLSTEEVTLLHDEILIQRDTWRCEWLDAEYKTIDNRIHINYEHRTNHKGLYPLISEPLEKHWILDDYASLLSCNRQGMPTAEGDDIYYKPPIWDNDFVSAFYTGIENVRLSCTWPDLSQSPVLSHSRSLRLMKVRPVKVKA